MESRAVIFCEGYEHERCTSYDLAEVASLYWTGQVHLMSFVLLIACAILTSVFLCAPIVGDPSIQNANAMATSLAVGAWCSVFFYAIFWLQHLSREQDAMQGSTSGYGWNTQDDPAIVFDRAIDHSKRWRNTVYATSVLVLMSSAYFMLSLTIAAIRLEPAMPLFMMVLILPGVLTMLYDKRRTKVLADTPTRLDWQPNVLGWPGIIRYDEDQ